MSYKKFKEFVQIKEAIAMPNQQASNPAIRANVQNNLQAAMKAPAPVGMKPVDFQNKVKLALNISKTAPTNSAASAMDIANATMRAAQP